jgi:hypothetical protein
VILEAGHTIQCNNFSKLETSDDGRVQSKDVARRKGTKISCTVDENIL